MLGLSIGTIMPRVERPQGGKTALARSPETLEPMHRTGQSRS